MYCSNNQEYNQVILDTISCLLVLQYLVLFHRPPHELLSRIFHRDTEALSTWAPTAYWTTITLLCMVCRLSMDGLVMVLFVSFLCCWWSFPPLFFISSTSCTSFLFLPCSRYLQVHLSTFVLVFWILQCMVTLSALLQRKERAHSTLCLNTAHIYQQLRLEISVPLLLHIEML